MRWLAHHRAEPGFNVPPITEACVLDEPLSACTSRFSPIRRWHMAFAESAQTAVQQVSNEYSAMSVPTALG